MPPTSTTCSAPGKLFLFGEYAVLAGGRAIVTAVDRRVVATCHATPTLYRAHGADVALTLPRHVLEAVGARVGVEHLETDVRAFFDGPNKLGLGSSAASTVALCAAVLAHERAGAHEHDNPLDRDAVLDAALRAHRKLQGGRGSGGDVACATWGGTIVYSMTEPWRALSTPRVELRAVWTGEPASSTALVGRVEEARAQHPGDIDRALRDIADVADRAVDAMSAAQGDSGGRLVELFALGDEAMERLGAAASAPIITERHRALRTLAHRHGAVAKPSGAGGGDFSLVVGTNVDWPALERELPAPCRIIPMQFGAEGVRAEPSSAARTV